MPPPLLSGDSAGMMMHLKRASHNFLFCLEKNRTLPRVGSPPSNALFLKVDVLVIPNTFPGGGLDSVNCLCEALVSR